MTSAMLGAFRSQKKPRDEFLAPVNYRTADSERWGSQSWRVFRRW
jgi:hypothetical protein